MKNRTRSYNRRLSKKSQVWISDYIISLLLFIIAIIIAVKIIINSFSTNVAFNEMKNDASKISEVLMSEGYPVNWDNDTVIRPGLLIGKRLNDPKVINAMNASFMTYDSIRTRLKTKYDFLVIFEHPDSDIIEFNDLCAIGSSSVAINSTGAVPGIDCHYANFTGLSYNNMVKLSRFVIYNSEITRMVVYVWD